MMYTNSLTRVMLALLCVVTMSACSDGGDSRSVAAPELPPEPAGPVEPQPTVDEVIRGLIAAHKRRGDAAIDRQLPDISDPLAQLGMKLFYSQSLAGQTDTACVSCHHPVLGGGDDLSLPVGVDAEIPELLGPGRLHSPVGFHFDGGPTVPRNAPTTFNIGLWDKVLFHDGRVESLGKTASLNGDDGKGIRTPDSQFGAADPSAENLAQAQARFPVTSAEEMRALFLESGSNQDVRDGLAARIVNQELPNTWLNEFQEAFNSTDPAADLITYQNISIALGEYERSQVFVDTPWRAYVQGDDMALTESAKRGAKLFYSAADEGGAECVACHSGDFFTDENFHVLAVPQIGRGKGDGDAGDDDFGRFRETGEEKDRYAFRTPTLLNVEVTGPFGHAGAHQTLEEVIRHHADPAAALDAYDYSLASLDPGIRSDRAEANTRNALAQLESLREAGESKLPVLELSDTDFANLVAFVESLTDPCVEDRDCLAPWIPPSDESGPDGLQMNGVDENGDQY